MKKWTNPLYLTLYTLVTLSNNPEKITEQKLRHWKSRIKESFYSFHVFLIMKVKRQTKQALGYNPTPTIFVN